MLHNIFLAKEDGSKLVRNGLRLMAGTIGDGHGKELALEVS